MPVSHCRLCSASLPSKPIFALEGMPRAAQHLPASADLAEDRGITLNLHECEACHLVQLANDPVPYYRDVLRAVSVSADIQQFRRAQFTRFFTHHELENKRVIEIGCGRGEHLDIARHAGLPLVGLEHSRDAVQHCQTKGFEVYEGFPGEAGWPTSPVPYDGFLMLNFLEHLPDPRRALHCIAQCLPAGGIGLVEVPNLDMILRHNLFTEFTVDHLLYFSTATLQTALALAGFECLTCEAVWHDYILSATIRRRPRLKFPRLAHTAAELREALFTYIDSFPPHRVAVWGAGHQALTVLAVADLAGRVSCVLDSAPSKQGRYTPATHIPITAPDALNAGSIDAVIVMAASYNGEVVELLQTRYPTIQVAVLEPDGLHRVLRDHSRAAACGGNPHVD